jgi:hypothetical protein
LSSCFAPSTAEEAEDDPVLEEIRYLDYRYIRFVFHPIRGKFQLMSNWRDPSWRNLKDVLDGLEGDTRDARAGLFGENIIDIEEKPIFKLLIDEARPLLIWADGRCYIHFTFSKYFRLYYGRWMNIITMQHVFFLSA